MHSQDLGGSLTPQGSREVDGPAAVARGGICVLGTPRTGTSLTAGALHRLGVFLGEDADLQQPDGGNPLGYYELPELTALNEELLGLFDGSLEAPPALGPGWEQAPRLAPLRRTARSLLDERFGGRPSWGWKDPRNSLTLPFWQGLVDGARYVICVRNPLDVAQSLRAIHGDGDGPELGSQMSSWVRYTALSLEHTSGCPRMIVDYDAFLSDPPRTARRLARFAGLGLTDEAVERAISGFADPSLALFHTPIELALEDERVSREASALYTEVRRLGSDSGRNEEPEVLARKWQSVERLANRLRTRAESADNGVAAGNGASRRAELEGGGRAAELEALVDEKESMALEHEARRASAEAELERERAALGHLRDRIAELERSLAAAERRLTGAEEARADQEAKRAAAEQRLADSERRHEAAEARAAELESERSRNAVLDEALEKQRGTAERLSGRVSELEAKRETLTRAKNEIEQRSEATLARLQHQIDDRDDSIRGLEAKVAELGQIAARELESVADRDERLVASQGQVAELLGHTERLKAAVEERDARLVAQKQFLQEQREDIHFRDAQHQEIILAMRQSKSWRMTRPYRRVAIFFRGITGRGDPDLKP